MHEELLVRHCSPTLAGMKTANMFSCSFENESEMKKSMRNLNAVLACDSVICNDYPDDEAIESCKALGAALA